MKNGYTKIFFSDPKSADLTSSKYKPSNNSEDHEEIKNVPHVFISFSCPLNATKRLETYVDFNILFADIRTVHRINFSPANFFFCMPAKKMILQMAWP